MTLSVTPLAVLAREYLSESCNRDMSGGEGSVLVITPELPVPAPFIAVTWNLYTSHDVLSALFVNM